MSPATPSPSGRWRRLLRRMALVLAGLVALVALAGRLATRLHPSLAPFAVHEEKPAPPPGAPVGSSLRVTFFGTTTLLFDDGETAWMTDGFFDRVGLGTVLFGKLRSDEAVVARHLDAAGVRRLAAVIPIHSHYDHAKDAPSVAARTGALLVGSTATANIGRGFGLPENRIRIVKDGDRLELGRFAITVITSRHAPDLRFPGDIEAPLTPPAPASAYRVGECYSLLVEHDGRTLLVHGSAGFVPGALQGRRAEVVYFGVGGLGRQPDAYRDEYFREVALAVGARRLILVHWDDFFRPLDEPLVPMPYAMDDVSRTMSFVLARSAERSIDVRIPRAHQVTDPFLDWSARAP